MNLHADRVHHDEATMPRHLFRALATSSDRNTQNWGAEDACVTPRWLSVSV
ncbi:hypothetical protein OQ252_10970 [Acetobacter farinalis]|uniref:Transposase n=1 Tax=Acetobacter farinalis TaxID=1260984 RepID=A0ABT3Q9E8_9PROT|nr:hypothetical protein [Acetobacter farinalis]MCX2561912.1 hypothetical protein [Acetobacter farinalis]NHO30491.1 hypothetical protein [Acetobacter farinalis]